MNDTLRTVADSQRRRTVAQRVGVLTVIMSAMCAGSVTCTVGQHTRHANPAAAPQALMAMGSSIDGENAPEWIAFEPANHDFSIAMPAAPVEVDDVVATPIGDQPVTRFTASSNGCDFDVGYLQRSANVLARLVGEEAILKSACDGTASHMGGWVVNRAALTVDDLPASDIQIRLKDDAVHLANARLVITEHRIYHAIVRMPMDASPSQVAGAQRFLESLHFATRTTAASP